MDEAEDWLRTRRSLGTVLSPRWVAFRDAYADKVLVVSREDADESRMARKGLATRLAGEVRLKPPYLCCWRCSTTTTTGWEETLRALTKIGTDSVIRELASRYPKEDLNFRLGVACLLEDIHSDRSVQTCLDLLEARRGPGYQGTRCSSRSC